MKYALHRVIGSSLNMECYEKVHFIKRACAGVDEQ